MQKLKALAALVIQAVLKKIKTEPVVIRTVVAAVLTFLVGANIIDTGIAETVENVVVALADALLIGSARARVIPEASVVASVAATDEAVDPAP